MVLLQVEDDMLADAADGGDTAVFERCRNFPSRGFQRLFFFGLARQIRQRLR